MRFLSDKVSGKELLLDLMEKKGFERKYQLAEYFGVSTRRISQWFHDDDINYNAARVLAENDQYSLDYLVFYRGSELVEMSANPLAHATAENMGDASPEAYRLLSDLAWFMTTNTSNRPAVSNIEKKVKQAALDFIRAHIKKNYVLPGTAARKLNIRTEVALWIDQNKVDNFTPGTLFSLLEAIGGDLRVSALYLTYDPDRREKDRRN